MKIPIKHNDSKVILSVLHSNIEKARNILEQYRDVDLNKELKLMRKEDVTKEDNKEL